MASTVLKFGPAKQARLIDELGALKAQIAALEAEYAQKVSVFKDFGIGEYVGKVYKLNVYEASRTVLDNKKVKGFLTPAQINECSTVTVSTVAKLSAR